MSPNISHKVIISLLVLIVVSSAAACAPLDIVPVPTDTQQSPTPIPASTSICGWIENASTTGVMAPIMTISGTGQVLQLAFLESDAIAKFNYVSPAFFVVSDPVYQGSDQLINFSSIKQVSACPAASSTLICGWIENASTTGVMAPTMTISGTGQVLQLAFLESDAIAKFNYVSPAFFVAHDPIYQGSDQLINFSSIEQVSACPAASRTSICGWIENSSTTGAMAPVMTVSGTGRVLQLAFLESDAIAKFNYTSPAYFVVHDPIYQAPDLLINFSGIEQVSACPASAQAYVNGFAGTWDTDWGDMTCSVNGQAVKCNYTHDSGKIEASLSADGISMEGTWSEAPTYLPPDDAGRVTFSLSADGNSLSGQWWYGQDQGGGSWTGTRK